jgi:hypothetical protein
LKKKKHAVAFLLPSRSRPSVQLRGIHLCYEGTPGYQAYGDADVLRRARVTYATGFGSQIQTWKRLSDDSVVDKQVLWTASRAAAAAPEFRARERWRNRW